MLFSTVFVASAFAAFANAQTVVTSSAASVAPSSTQSQSMPPQATAGFNIGNVSTTLLFNWCLGQQNTCPEICGGAASINTCEPSTLVYSCVCPNGTVPDCSAYIETVPFYECQATYAQCINNHPNDAEGQATCKSNEQCGTKNATALALAQSSAASSSSASSTSSSTGSATASSGSATASAHNAAPISSYQSGAFAAVLLAAFKLLL